MTLESRLKKLEQKKLLRDKQAVYDPFVIYFICIGESKWEDMTDKEKSRIQEGIDRRITEGYARKAEVIFVDAPPGYPHRGDA
jgi:hypothetical protein